MYGLRTTSWRDRPSRSGEPDVVEGEPPPTTKGSQIEPRSDRKRDDFFYEAWDMFLALEPKRAKRTSRAARRIQEMREAVAQSGSGGGRREGLDTRANAAASWEQAAAECRAKVAAIVRECQRLNQRYRDALFDLGINVHCVYNLRHDALDGLWTMSSTRRVQDVFDSPQFIIDGQTAADVHQGEVGDCWFLAALMAVTAKKELIDNLCVARDEKVGVYGFVFYRDGEWIEEVVDDQLLVRYDDDDDLDIVRDWNRDKKQGISIPADNDKLRVHLRTGGEMLVFSHCKSDETWLPLIEKAYAKAHGDYESIEGGWASEGIEDLTGGVASTIMPSDIMDRDRFWREELLHVNTKYLFGGSTSNRPSKGVIENHAYAVLEAFEEGDLKLLKLRNPWGQGEWSGDWSDGSKLWTPRMMEKLGHTFGDDGIFWMSYVDFLRHFQRINRVQLFNHEWQVSQQWTSVEIPWTVDYLDTKFQFAIKQQCSVVIVLSQPDSRYYKGLAGRFKFALHFRVQRAGGGSDDDDDDDDDGHYLVRSMQNSGGSRRDTRSVSAEIDALPPGTYDVVFKVTATRCDDRQTPPEAVLEYAELHKDKLLHVGRRYDYAHAKGNLRATETEVRRRWRDGERDAQLASLKKARRSNMKERERARRRTDRIEDATKRAAEKAIAKLEKEKEEAREKRKQERQERVSVPSVSNVVTAAVRQDQASPITQTNSEAQTLVIVDKVKDTTAKAAILISKDNLAGDDPSAGSPRPGLSENAESSSKTDDQMETKHDANSSQEDNDNTKASASEDSVDKTDIPPPVLDQASASRSSSEDAVAEQPNDVQLPREDAKEGADSESRSTPRATGDEEVNTSGDAPPSSKDVTEDVTEAEGENPAENPKKSTGEADAGQEVEVAAATKEDKGAPGSDSEDVQTESAASSEDGETPVAISVPSFADDDFEWDSELDGPVYTSDSELDSPSDFSSSGSSSCGGSSDADGDDSLSHSESASATTPGSGHSGGGDNAKQASGSQAGEQVVEGRKRGAPSSQEQSVKREEQKQRQRQKQRRKLRQEREREREKARRRFSAAPTNKDNEIFARDPWNAVCTLGLRVYSLGAAARIRVARKDQESDGDDDNDRDNDDGE